MKTIASANHKGGVGKTATVHALGAALAAWDGKFNLLIFGLVLVGSVAIHAGTNLINDYYDWRKGTDTAESLGPNRPLKEKLVTPRQVLIAGLLCFALGGGIGLYLVADRGGQGTRPGASDEGRSLSAPAKGAPPSVRTLPRPPGRPCPNLLAGSAPTSWSALPQPLGRDLPQPLGRDLPQPLGRDLPHLLAKS